MNLSIVGEVLQVVVSGRERADASLGVILETGKNPLSQGALVQLLGFDHDAIPDELVSLDQRPASVDELQRAHLFMGRVLVAPITSEMRIYVCNDQLTGTSRSDIFLPYTSIYAAHQDRTHDDAARRQFPSRGLHMVLAATG